VISGFSHVCVCVCDDAAMALSADLSPAYKGVILGSTPCIRLWGRLDVRGLELLPTTGPVLLAGNHDSYWDPIAVGVASAPVRQVHALAKSTLWKTRIVARVLDGMGQIPIERGKGDVGAMARAEEALRGGACIGIFPEGTRSLGRDLRARSGFGRLAQAVPEAQVIAVRTLGAIDVPRLTVRPRIVVEFFIPQGGPIADGESPTAFSQRILDEIRAGAPREIAGRKRRRAAGAGDRPG